MIDRVKVLDHGYVEFKESMGTDATIVEAARMSTGRGFVSWEPYKRCKKCEGVWSEVQPGISDKSICFDGGCDYQDFPRGDLGVLDHMYRNRHTSPFEFCSLHLEVQAPIMVFREWHRHRTQKFSEFSARYSQMPDLHYLPDASRVALQSRLNRQGSGEALSPEQAEFFRDRWASEQATVYRHYDMAVNEVGVAKEVARLNTPVSRYSKMRVKTDLHNWLGFLRLRLAPSAQYEIRCYAEVVAAIVKERWPKTYSLFEEYDLGGVRLSRSEVEAFLDAGYGDDGGLSGKVIARLGEADAIADNVAAVAAGVATGGVE